MSIDYSGFAFPKNARIENKKLINQKAHKCEYCHKRNCYTNTHHIKSKGSGGGDTEENLIELCSNCHRKVHDGIIKKQDLLKIIERRKKMSNNKGITLIALVVTIIVLLILTGISIGFVTDFFIEGQAIKDANTLKQQENCQHDWVITSKYDFILESYRTITKCSKCGKEVM